MRNACPPLQPTKAGWRIARRDRGRRVRVCARWPGLRRITLWIPDPSSAAIRAEARRESLLLASQQHETETMDFLESLTDAGDWEE